METDTTNEVTELIEQGDYIAAKKAAESGSTDDKRRVTNAQVSDLITQGRFDIAADVAKEDGFYITYYDGIINHLSQIYTDQGGDKLLYALSLVTYPDPKEDTYLPNFWGAVYSEDKSNDIIKRSNKNIESFCDYLKSTGDRTFIPKVLVYLKPIYIAEETKWDVKKQETIHIKDAYTDYSEVKRIKAKFGY